MPDTASKVRRYRVAAITVASATGGGGVAVDPDDNLHCSDSTKVYRLEPNGTLTTRAGQAGGHWNGGTSAADLEGGFYYPGGMAFDSGKNAYYTDSWNHVVRKISADGTTTSIVAGRWLGNDTGKYEGDKGPATKAALNRPRDVALDGQDRLLVLDSDNGRIRRVATDGTIDSLTLTAGANLGADGVALVGARALTIDRASGVLYVSDTVRSRVVAIDTNGVMTLVAGGNGAGWAGDGDLATAAKLNHPRGIALDGEGNLLIADFDNHRVRIVDADKKISTLLGTGSDAVVTGNLAASTATATVPRPQQVAVDSRGHVYVSRFASPGILRIERPWFAVPSSTAYDFGTGAFSVLATISPGAVPKTGTPAVAAGTLVSRYAPYQKALGGWELSLVVDPVGRAAGPYLSFRAHHTDGTEQTALFSMSAADLKTAYRGGWDADANLFARTTRVVVLTRDDKGAVTLYLEGRPVTATATTGSGTPADVSNVEPLNVGRLFLSGPPRTEGGLVRNVGLWNTALSRADVVNFSHAALDPRLNLKAVFTVTPTYTTPQTDDEGYQVHMGGTLTISARDGDLSTTVSDAWDTVTKTLGELKLEAAQLIDPDLTRIPSTYTVGPLKDVGPGTATITVTKTPKPPDPPGPPVTQTLTVYYGDTRDHPDSWSRHQDLWEGRRRIAAENIRDQADGRVDERRAVENAESSWFRSYTTNVALADLEAVGLWTLRGSAPVSGFLGQDLSSRGNDVPADQRADPDKALDTVLPFTLQKQVGNNWCWAATSVSVANYYDPSKAAERTPGALVLDRARDVLWSISGTDLGWPADRLRRPLGPSETLADDPKGCDYINYAPAGLNAYGNFVRVRTRSLGMDELRAELRRGHPVVVRIVWGKETLGAHFVVIAGTFTDTAVPDGVVVSDPWWGVTTMSAADFPTKYQVDHQDGANVNTWKNTSWTRPAWVRD